MGIPWRSSGWDSVLSLPGAWVRSLVRELRSCRPRGAAKKKLSFFFRYIGPNVIFLFFFFALISIIRSYLVTLLLIYSPPTTLDFLKYRSVVSISCQNSISEFSLSLLFSSCTVWSLLRPTYCGGGRCSKREEEQVRLWTALLWNALWRPDESLVKRKMV